MHPDLRDYASHVAKAVRSAGEPVILVGHSMGGLVISQVAERVGESLSALVYVAGLMLRDGETLQSFLDNHADLGVEDLVLKNMVVSDGGALAHFPPAVAPEIFYGRCSAPDAAWASAQLRPQPTAVYASPLELGGEKNHTVPRYYVMCEDDRAVPAIYQRQMLANTPCRNVFRLDADHSPFLSAPEALLESLLEVAERAA